MPRYCRRGETKRRVCFFDDGHYLQNCTELYSTVQTDRHSALVIPVGQDFVLIHVSASALRYCLSLAYAGASIADSNVPIKLVCEDE